MIGIFDSGSGGLSVLGPLRKAAPRADIVYLADIAHLPYGDKTLEEIDRLTYEGMRELVRHGATQIINACNTVSASLTPGKISLFDVGRDDLLEMIGPTLSAIKKDPYKKIAIVATRATIRLGAYQRGLDMLGIGHADIPAPDIVPAIESGAPKEKLDAIVRQVVSVVRKEGCDALLLGCTHFPLVRESFEDGLRKEGIGDVVIIDPARFVVQEALKGFDMSGEGKLIFVLSKDSDVFRDHAEKIIGTEDTVWI